MDLDAKVYVVDTSALVRNPGSIELLSKGNRVVIPHAVVQELDGLKDSANGRGTAARRAINMLLGIQNQAPERAASGIRVATGGEIVFDGGAFSPEDAAQDQWEGYSGRKDDIIIRLARRTRRLTQDAEVVLVTEDASMILKARPLGITAQQLKALPAVPSIADDLYSGRITIVLKDGWAQTAFRALHQHRVLAADALLEHAVQEYDLVPNQCCTIQAESGKAVHALYKAGPDARFSLVEPPERGDSEIRPGSVEQAFAYAMCTDPDIDLVTIAGPAGTGKTLMALLAAWNQMPQRFSRIVTCRPIVEVGGGEGNQSSLGYMPGDMFEKLVHWHQPVFDNMELILKGGRKTGIMGAQLDPAVKKYGKVRELLAGDPPQLVMYPISHLRGMSIHDAFILCDEAQNLKADEGKVLLTRPAGEPGKYKLVFTGDPDQSDLGKDPRATGLVRTMEAMKGWEHYGHITLTESSALRSRLVREAVKRY